MMRKLKKINTAKNRKESLRLASRGRGWNLLLPMGGNAGRSVCVCVTTMWTSFASRGIEGYRVEPLRIALRHAALAAARCCRSLYVHGLPLVQVRFAPNRLRCTWPRLLIQIFAPWLRSLPSGRRRGCRATDDTLLPTSTTQPTQSQPPSESFMRSCYSIYLSTFFVRKRCTADGRPSDFQQGLRQLVERESLICSCWCRLSYIDRHWRNVCVDRS